MMPSQIGPQSDIKLQNITHEELKRIEKSMKRPQFLGLLNEYMVEISDPKNREQYDEYLRQMQRQGELPKHLKLVELTPHFCIRTSIVSQKNRKHNMKFFINFCSTQFLQEPSCQPSLNQEGKTAFGWKVPNSMGKIRYDQDKGGNPCQVADVAFNHKAFEIVEAENNMPFRKNQFKSMLITIGLQCAQKQLGERKQTLSKDYDILKNLKCKGGKPALLPLRYIEGKAYNKGQGPQENIIQRDTQGRQTKLQKQITDLKQKAAEEKNKQQKKDEQEEMQQQLQDKKKLIQDLDEGIQQPKYSSIYTYPVDYSQFLQDQSYQAKKVPSHFTVEFKIPRVESMDEIGGDALNVNENRIILKVGQKYFIDLPFQILKTKYKLITQNVKAKFDKKKKVLKLIFPIDQSIKYHQQEPRKSEEVTEIQETQKQQGQVVENQTWKNKVLELSEPTVDLKIIENQQVKEEQQIEEPKKKLIQQIDEDDYPEEMKENQNNNTNAAEPSSFEQALEQQKSHAFSLRKYYQKKDDKVKNQVTENIATQIKPNELTYVFQQTNDKVVLVIKIPNYKKQDVKVVYDELENNNFFIKWNTNQQNQKDLTKISVLNFKIDQKIVREIKKVEVVMRINFVAIFIHKATLNKFWEKQSILTVPLQNYEQFKQQMDQIDNANQERAEINKKNEQQLKEKQAQNTKESVKALENKENIPQRREKIQQNAEVSKKVYQIDNQKDQKEIRTQSTKLQGQYFNFNNLPPQFLQFDMKFIEAMD